MHDVAIIPIGVVGTGKKSWVLPGNFQIAGVIIDNRSGSWLWIPQDNTFIPPYTLEFAHTFHPTMARVDILFANGPAGQISTRQGDSLTATIYDQPVADSAGQPSGSGTPFVTGFTPAHIAYTFAIIGGVTGNVIGGQVINDGVAVNLTTGPQPALGIPFITAVAGKRIRLRSLTVGLGQRRNLVAPAMDADSGCDIYIAPSSLLPQVLAVIVRPDADPTVPIVSAGIDFSIGDGVNWYAFPHWADVSVQMSASYEII